jgi:predicted phage-related endonuclease
MSIDRRSTSNASNPQSDLQNRHDFIGGSDARVIVGKDEKALLRLWKEKRGEAPNLDLSGELIVQLGLVTELGLPD